MEYSVSSYGAMIADDIRMDAYAAALERVVTPESVVLDIGTGTGIFALLACRLGARRVFAVDPSPVIEVARQAARDNGFEDRIEFFETSSTSVEIPEQADVVISDLRGVLPHYTVHLKVVDDARRRLLKEGGVLIPQRDVIWASLAEAPGEGTSSLDVWRTHGRGFDLEAARTLVSNQFWKAGPVTQDPLSEPHLLATVDYSTGAAGDLTASTTLAAIRDGQLHGLYAWFDTVLIEGIGFSNAPWHPEALYGRAFFPLPEEVPVAEGEQVSVTLSANFVTGDYVYRWDVRVGSVEQPRAQFRQSTFAGIPLSAHALHAADEAHVPSLSPDGHVARTALELMDGTRSLSEIADALAPDAPSREEALSIATALAQKYSG